MVMASEFISISYTATDDNGHNILPSGFTDLIFQELDLQILTNDAYYGDKQTQEFELTAGDIVSFRSSTGVNLKDIFFKNQGAGNNIKVVCVGLLKK